MGRIATVVIFSGLAACLFAQDIKRSAEASTTMPIPALPHYDWNVCPGEGCVYRQWTARKPMTVYDTWKPERRPVSQLSAKAKVTGVTGVVITFEPGVIHMNRDLPEKGLKHGDTILTYAYRGEGVSAVWFKGKYFRDFDISYTKWPDGAGCQGAICAATYVDLGKSVWWAEVKLSSGGLGWVDMDQADFDGTCSLAR